MKKRKAADGVGGEKKAKKLKKKKSKKADSDLEAAEDLVKLSPVIFLVIYQ